MKFAYADPPYIGQAKRHYNCEEIDHAQLIKKLVNNYDGWALSLTSISLKQILPLCPDSVRVGAWVKPFAFFKGKGRPCYAWEPVIWSTPRKSQKREKGYRDWISLNAFGVTKKEREQAGNVKGMKREEFCFWIFNLLGINKDDEFDDLFYGSGAVTRAWDKWRSK